MKRSSPFDRLQLLVKNISQHSPIVTHPDQIMGCSFTVNLPPGATFIQPWGGDTSPEMPEGITFLGGGMPFQNYSVEWTEETGNILNRFDLAYGPHWTIDFCRDAWESWQAGDWDKEQQ